jgi:hypothetical protein
MKFLIISKIRQFLLYHLLDTHLQVVHICHCLCFKADLKMSLGYFNQLGIKDHNDKTINFNRSCFYFSFLYFVLSQKRERESSMSDNYCFIDNLSCQNSILTLLLHIYLFPIIAVLYLIIYSWITTLSVYFLLNFPTFRLVNERLYRINYDARIRPKKKNKMCTSKQCTQNQLYRLTSKTK